MKYVYDIVLNFNDEYYPFYEWDINDNIINIRKTPLIRVTDKCYLDIKYNNVKLNQEFIKTITNQTTLYVTTTKNPICLISNNKEVMGIMINEQEIITKRSSLIFDEEDEALELCNEIKITDITYEKTSPLKINEFSPRIEKQRKQKITNLINELYKTNNLSALKYIYYDIFEKENNNKEELYAQLIEYIKNKNTNLNKISPIFKAIKKEII